MYVCISDNGFISVDDVGLVLFVQKAINKGLLSVNKSGRRCVFCTVSI